MLSSFALIYKHLILICENENSDFSLIPVTPPLAGTGWDTLGLCHIDLGVWLAWLRRTRTNKYIWLVQPLLCANPGVWFDVLISVDCLVLGMYILTPLCSILRWEGWGLGRLSGLPDGYGNGWGFGGGTQASVTLSYFHLLLTSFLFSSASFFHFVASCAPRSLPALSWKRWVPPQPGIYPKEKIQTFHKAMPTVSAEVCFVRENEGKQPSCSVGKEWLHTWWWAQTCMVGAVSSHFKCLHKYIMMLPSC